MGGALAALYGNYTMTCITRIMSSRVDISISPNAFPFCLPCFDSIPLSSSIPPHSFPHFFLPRSSPLPSHRPQVQEASNRAAGSYDKASSEHAAAREIVRMAEVELGKLSSSNGDSPTANIDPAWQETLNHATTRVGGASRLSLHARTHIHISDLAKAIKAGGSAHLH